MNQNLTDPQEVARARRIFLLTTTAIVFDMALDAPVIKERIEREYEERVNRSADHHSGKDFHVVRRS